MAFLKRINNRVSLDNSTTNSSQYFTNSTTNKNAPTEYSNKSRRKLATPMKATESAVRTSN